VKGRGGDRTRGTRVGRVLIPILVVAVAGFLYARPLSNYTDTKADLAERERSVLALRREKAVLTERLARTTDLQALARQARGIGYVRPGEHLFIVKGIPEWRARHRP
jgi:cell division protein FtsB